MSAHRHGWLGSRVDATRLFWQAWDPTASAGGAVVLVHGAAEHGGRYAYVAERLVSEGYAAYAIDHRGHGRSYGPRALISRFDHLVDDLGLFVTRVREDHGGRAPFLVGHSLGGAVALRFAIGHGSDIAGLAVSGPAVATKAIPTAVKAATTVLSVLAPRLPVLKIEADAISRDPDVVRAYQRDPLNYNGRLPARTLAEIMRCMDSLPRRVGGLRDSAPTSPWIRTIGCALRKVVGWSTHWPPRRDKTLKIYDGLYHEVFNEPERAQVVGDLVEWIVERT